MSVLQSQFHFCKAHSLLQAVLWHKSVVASWSSNPEQDPIAGDILGQESRDLAPDLTLQAVFSVGHPENLFTTKKSHCVRVRSFIPQHWSALYSSYSKMVFSRWAGHVEERKGVLGQISLYFRSPTAPSTICILQEWKGCMSSSPVSALLSSSTEQTGEKQHVK